jgi:hypothetical protein
MATASVPYPNFVNGTPADADQVDANFAALVAFSNNSVIHRDGTKAMTAPLDVGGFKVTNAAGGTNAADLVTKAQLDALSVQGDYKALGSDVTIGTSATTIDTLSVTAPSAGLGFVVLAGSFTSSGVSYAGDGFAAVGVNLAVVGVEAVVVGAMFTSDTTTATYATFVVPLSSGANTITIQGTRVNNVASGGTITAVSGFKTAIVGMF